MAGHNEALDQRAKAPNYPLILILSAKRPAPGLPFVRQLHWVLTDDPASEATVAKLINAALIRAAERWRGLRMTDRYLQRARPLRSLLHLKIVYPVRLGLDPRGILFLLISNETSLGIFLW